MTRERDRLRAALLAQLEEGWLEPHGRQGGSRAVWQPELKEDIAESHLGTVLKTYRQKRKGRVSQAEGIKQVAAQELIQRYLRGIHWKTEAWRRFGVKMSICVEPSSRSVVLNQRHLWLSQLCVWGAIGA